MGGWSSSFLAFIERSRIQIGATLRPWSVYTPPDGYLFTDVDTLATTESGGGKPLIVDVETSGDDLDPYDVSQSTLGEWAVLVAVGSFGDLGPVNPGSLVQLDVYDVGAPATSARVLFGIVHNVERVDDTLYRIRVRSAVSMLGSRYTVSAEDLALFSDRASTSKVDPAWTPGDPTLPVASYTGFRTETGGEGMIKVTPSEGNGAGTEPFFLRWTSTGTGGGPSYWFNLPTGLGALDTTALALDAGYGHTTREVWFVEDHPLQVFAKTLVSTGTGYNGSYDRLPDTWGFGILEEYVDIDDIEYWVLQSMPATGSASWQVWSDTEQTDPGDWLIGVLASGGWWPTMRQGRLTARALVSPADRPELAEVTITDDDLIQWDEIEAYDAGSSAGAKTMRAVGPTVTGSYSEDVTRLPATRYTDVDVASYAHANETEWVSSIATRIGPWRLRTCERRVGVFAGLRLAQLAPGSVVLLTVSGDGRFAPYVDRPALVTSVSPSWFGGAVRVTLAIQPSNGEITTIVRP